MTYSIVVRDPLNGHLGIATASRFFSVGSIVPSVCSQVGAVASQAFANPTYGGKALQALARNHSAQQVLDQLIDNDQGAAHRQCHLIDNQGRNAAFTGAQCIDWAGHRVADNVSVAGNMLAGPEVITQTLQTWESSPHLAMTERLLLAMQAGEDAGGDKRGKQSAALLIYRDQDYPWLDLRVDDHADPLQELRRLYAVAQERYLIMCEAMATRENPHGELDRTELDAKLQAHEKRRKQLNVPSSSYGTGFEQ